ncbi:MAG: sugar ABC transporter substrate-binding protein [Treponema sp.]|jgi:multiple sugar transport system substrate-binding protein|nr:sugar ABC transporter substrate-binding protein [Treponema sp.]
MKLRKLTAATGIILLMTGSWVFGSGQSSNGSTAPKDSSASGPFDWKRFSGKEITVYMVEHSTSTALQSKLKDFEAQTGIKVNIQVTPEANYFDQVSNALSSRSGTPDLFMSGVYQLWDYFTAGNVEPLDPYLSNPSLTVSDYDFNDIVSSTIGALRWDGVPGHPVGTGNLLALPLGCEIYSLAYNKRAFEKAGITKVPETYDELLEACDKLKEWNGPGSYAIALRGARDWGTIHPAYMSTYANFGAKDFAIEGGKLVSKVNSPESVKMNQFWVELVKRGGSPQWSTTYWYIGQAELGAGKAAMQWDADNNSIQVNLQNMAEGGNIAFAPMPVAKQGDPIKSNFWIWSMGMNANSKNKGAAWLFLQYFTGKAFLEYASVTGNNMDPVRTSTWNSSGFKAKMATQEGYIDTFNKTSSNATILFTPQPAFFQTTLDWAESLQNMVAGTSTVQAALDTLKQRMDRAVQE